MKLGLIAKSAGEPRWSMAISYANSRSFGPLDPYIEELYLLTDMSVADLGCEIACINHQFFLAIIQNFSSEAFLGLFLNELSSVGLNYEVMGEGPLRLCGFEAYSPENRTE